MMRHDYDYHDGCGAGRVELELSLKPFVDTSAEGCRKVARTLFRQWMPLIRRGTSTAVMLWVADGSEILDYNGREEDDFPWCQYIGTGNPTVDEHTIHTPEQWLSLHVRPFPYRGPEELRKFTYGELKRVVTAIKEVGREMTGEEIKVIATFDPGPEFAPSSFKFERHAEISRGSNVECTTGDSSMNGKVKGWVNAAATLHADKHPYATYPDGIPEGTPFGEFLGRQAGRFCDDLGFDGLWLSNGFGFAFSAWNWQGQVFDGKRFRAEDIKTTRDGIRRFWETFTHAFGDRIIEARGTNLSTAIDIATHGSPVDTIYSYPFLTPPNSPWAALDSRFGLELVGYLSHIAETTEKGYLFRYYIHDPWWYNSPWFDRYGGNPHDIYLPLSTARLDGKGNVTRPAGLNLLSCDDSFGHMPERLPIEVIPHLNAAFDTYSDAPGLLTWVYPFRYYCEHGLRDRKPEDIFLDDWYMESAVDAGLPLGSVISDANLATCTPEKLRRTILVSRVPDAGTLHEEGILKTVRAGLRILFYGSTANASDTLLKLIGVTHTASLGGTDFDISTTLTEDTFVSGSVSHTLRHVPLVSGGGLIEVARPGTDVTVTVRGNGETRTYGTYNKDAGIAWIRGSFPHNADVNGQIPKLLDHTKFFPVGTLMRLSLQKFGVTLRFFAFHPNDKLPLLLYPASRGGYFQTGFSKNTTIRAALSTPMGAPIPVTCDAIVEDSVAYVTPKVWGHDELRVFVKQKERSSITCRLAAPETLLVDHHIILEGLCDATVTFLAPKGDCVQFGENMTYHLWKNNKEYTCPEPDVYVVPHCNGLLSISWQSRDAREELTRLGHTYPPKQVD